MNRELEFSAITNDINDGVFITNVNNRKDDMSFGFVKELAHYAAYQIINCSFNEALSTITYVRNKEMNKSKRLLYNKEDMLELIELSRPYFEYMSFVKEQAAYSDIGYKM